MYMEYWSDGVLRNRLHVTGYRLRVSPSPPWGMD